MSVQSFKFNHTNIRFFESGDRVWFVTSDANNGFGFAGQNTRLDRLSIQLKDLAKDTDYILSLENLAKNTLVISLPDLIEGIIKFDSPELKGLGKMFVQLAADGFMAARVKRDRPILLPMPSDKRMMNSAISAKLQTTDQKKRRRRGEFAGWNTAKGLVCKLISEPGRRRAYLNDNKCMYRLRTALTAEYAATTGEKPPKVKSYNCKSQGLGYPPAYEALAKAYLLAWRDGGTSAAIGQSLLT
jgi:hypothetical protein